MFGISGINNAPILNPKLLNCTLFCAGNYSSAPWVGTASAGTSSSNSLSSSGTDPTSGTALNGFTPATFSSQFLTTPTSTGLWGASGSICVLFNASSASAASGTHFDGTFISEATTPTVSVGFTTSGICGNIISGVTDYRLDIAASTNAWHLCQFKWDGTNIYLRLDSGGWSSLAAGSPSNTNYCNVGLSFAATYFAGSIMEILSSSTALDHMQFDQYKAYCNNRYALAL
jgi:hypothetical protein